MSLHKITCTLMTTYLDIDIRNISAKLPRNVTLAMIKDGLPIGGSRLMDNSRVMDNNRVEDSG